MADWLVTMKAIILRKAKGDGASFQLTPEIINWCAQRSGNQRNLNEIRSTSAKCHIGTGYEKNSCWGKNEKYTW